MEEYEDKTWYDYLPENDSRYIMYMKKKKRKRMEKTEESEKEESEEEYEVEGFEKKEPTVKKPKTLKDLIRETKPLVIKKEEEKKENQAPPIPIFCTLF